MFESWGLAEWAALVGVLGYFGIDVRTGFAGAKWFIRKLKGNEEPPQRVTIVAPEPQVEAEKPHSLLKKPETQILWSGFPQGDPLIGRDTEIAELRARLKNRGEVALVNSGAILAGQGGIGKTSLARGFAEIHRGDYDGGLWARAQNRRALIEDLMGLAGPLGVAVKQPYDLAQAKALLAKLQTTDQCWLLVYDNAEDRADLDGLIPDRDADHIHLIVTSRQKDGWAGFDVVATDKLSIEDPDGAAVQLLMRAADKPDDGKAWDLARALDGLPLALVVAGGLIREFDSYADYLDRLDEIIAAAPKSGDYPDAVIGAVRASYEKLSEDAQRLIDVMAWWAPEGLEPRLFTDAPTGVFWEAIKEDVPEDLAALCGDPARVRAAFLELTGRSLLTRSEEGWTLHRMSAAALRADEEAADTAARAAAALLRAVYPGGEKSPAYSPQWPECARLTPHVQALFATDRLPVTVAMDSLLNQTSAYLVAIADLEVGLSFARASLSLTEQRLPEEDPVLAFGHHNLGTALMQAGDLDGAETALRRAVDLHERHRPGSADLAESYAALGSLYLRRLRAGQAEAAQEADAQFGLALALREKLFGRESEAVAQTLNNLAVLRDLEGRLPEAAELAGEALEIRRAVLPEKDARLGYPLMNAGALALKAGAAGRAEALLIEALALREEVHADRPAHPDRRNAAEWLISALLVNAMRGAGDAARIARARDLAKSYGLDWAAFQASVAQHPDPTDQPPT